jgi:SAM-dependent methyltransferase
MKNNYLCPNCRVGSEFSGPRKTCTSCGASERTRAVAEFYLLILPKLTDLRALAVSPDGWLMPEWFARTELSTYGGSNHMDIQAIDRPDCSYDWIILNHVLEHVPDDRAAIRELRRILSPEGILQISVPEPFNYFETHDWGFPDPAKDQHFRTYGSDLCIKLRQEFKGSAFVIEARDILTPHRDWIFCLSPGYMRLRDIAKAARAGGNAVIRIF